MATVTAVQPKGDKAGILVMDDGSRVWTPEKAKGDELVGKPIPADWTIKQGDYGPQAFPPRAKGGGGAPAAYRNTREGFEAEQAAMNRRTALMQAVEWVTQTEPHADAVLTTAMAEHFYAWLTKASGGAASGKAAATERGTNAPPSATSVPASPPGPSSVPAGARQGPVAFGEGETGPEGSPAGSDSIETKLNRCYQIAGGTGVKLMRYIKDEYPAWLTDPEMPVHKLADLQEWHMDRIIEDAA